MATSASRWYRRLLRLLPFEFRADFGAQMEETFGDEQAEVTQRGGLPLVGLWLRTVVDFARTAPRQHWNIVAQDLRHGVRMIRRQPGFAAAAILTIALAVGASTTVFTVVNAVVLRPLPYPAPERLVYLANTSRSETRPGRFDGVMSYRQFRLLQQHARGFADIGIMDQGRVSLKRAGAGDVSALLGSASLLRLVGARPLHGRLLTAEDESPSAAPAAVLTYRGWVARFGGDPRVVGQTLLRERDERLEPVTIVGVLSEESLFPSPVFAFEADAWVPFDPALVDSEGWEAHNEFAFIFLGFGRLGQGASLEEAQRELDRFAKLHASEYQFSSNDASGMRVKELREELAGNARQPLLLFLVTVCLLLVIACVNVGSLLLARASARRQELAVRASLGAGRLRLARQLFTESLLLASLGTGLGACLAVWGTRLFIAIAPRLPRGHEVSVDWRVAAFTLTTFGAAILVTGLAPAVQSSRHTVADNLRHVGLWGPRGPAWRRPLWGLLTVQLALALVLLAAGALMVNSLVRLVTFPLGFDPRAVVILDYRQPARRDIARVAASKEEQRSGVAVLSAVQRQAATLNAEIVRRVGSMPGVESATVANRVPVVGGRSRTSVEIEGRDRSLPPFTADTRSVSPGYFSTLRLRLVRGRSLNERDREGAPRVVLVNETMARTAWPGEEPVGKRLAVNGARAMVVGLIADVHHHGARDDVPPEVYSSDLQSPRDWSTLVVRGVGGQPPTEDALIASLKATEPSIQTGRFRSLEEAGAELRAGERFAAALLGGVAVLGLTLVLVGVHGVVSYLVQQRKREIAIRMALGAAPSRVIREVVGSALPYTAVGVTMGLALAWQGGSLLRTLVFGVTATDTTTLLTVSGLLVGAVVAAAYRPARRVANADPLCTLRDD